MRAPVNSESDAFRLTLGAALLVAASVVIGALVDPLVGLVVFAAGVVIALLVYLSRAGSDRRPKLRAAAQAPHPHGATPGRRHVLVVANETLTGSDLREQILHGDAERVEVDVLAPVLSSPLHLGMTDIDDELQAARTRLERSLAWARDQGIDARGEVGDPSPTTALEDALRDFGADEVIVVTHHRVRETWQERAELERLRQELGVPVKHVVIGDKPAGLP